MIAERIVRNKYKLIGAIIIVLIGIDSYMHKGLVRVFFPKKYPQHAEVSITPDKRNHLINTNKNWIKAVNSVERMDSKVDKTTSGIEFDIYFDTTRNIFDVHHDIDNSTGLNFETLLDEYQKNGLQASIWMDFKNLDNSTVQPALKKIIQLREHYHLVNKILVESNRADLLQYFGDSGFYTSYYAPMFNPYLMNDSAIKQWADSISVALKNSSVNALSGYYFQYTFLHHYFPQHDILIWSPNDRFSLINWLYKKKINAADEIFISLYY
jgi:hypothetical protein